MRVFLTGATGFIGSHLTAELVEAGHRVIGLTRRAAGAEALARAGAEVLRGDITDLKTLRLAAESAEAVIHTAFNHDFANIKEHSENDRNVIAALGEVLNGSNRPFIITSGTGLVKATPPHPAQESDASMSAAEFPRAATEEAADALMAAGERVMVIRLPQVHDAKRQGRISWHIAIARQKGRVAYVGEGLNRLPAVHVNDAVHLYRLALERGRGRARYHAVAEEGVALRDIARIIGAGLKLPVESIPVDEAPGYFGGLAHLAMLDLWATSSRTRQELDWSPVGPDLLTDLKNMDFSATG